METLPEELELRWMGMLSWRDLVAVSAVCSRWRRLGADKVLWAKAFAAEFGREALTTVLSQRVGAPLSEMIESLWLAPAGTIVESLSESYFWYNVMCYFPRGDPIHFYDGSDQEDWVFEKVIRNLQCTAQEGTSAPKDLNVNDGMIWKQLFIHHYRLRHIWIHGCDVSTEESKRPHPDRLLRVIVTGASGSGKSSFLQALSTQAVDHGIGVNAVSIDLPDVTVVLLEVKRSQGWFGKPFNGAIVDGVISIVDVTDFVPFQHESGEERFESLKDIYTGLHATTGEAHRGKLALTVCAHKIDLVEEDVMVEAVNALLRVDELGRCNWYSSPRASTVGTSAHDPTTCRRAVEDWLLNWASTFHWQSKRGPLQAALERAFERMPDNRLDWYRHW